MYIHAYLLPILNKKINIALIGNPNSGKTSLFNTLTGLNQQVGNFPGVTVDKKTGSCNIADNLTATIIDLPGTYSLYPRRADEWIAYHAIMGADENLKPDLLILVADASNLTRNLLFCSQIIDLKIPVVIAFTMMDMAKQNGSQIDVAGMERELGVPIVPINPRKNKGITALKKSIQYLADNLQNVPNRLFIETNPGNAKAIHAAQALIPNTSTYKVLHYLINTEQFNFTQAQLAQIEHIKTAHIFNPTKSQAEEITQRYSRIKQIMQQTVAENDLIKKSLLTEKLDDIFLHKTGGYLILLAVLFLMFQSVYWLAQFPMDAIEWSLGKLSGYLLTHLPAAWYTDILVNGVLAGLSGILVFIPQIMILFGVITLLEDTGYMARISFLTDKLMRKVGLNGKSVMPMISAYACAVPAIMSARNIENKKERLLTIMITPLMSCSARLPVYTILIALVIPSKLFFGFLSLQGLVMMVLYLLGTVLALLVAWVLKWFIKSTERSFFILELPKYRAPRWKNMLVTMVEKAKIFVLDAGKIIMIISILLWVLSSFGPMAKMNSINEQYDAQIKEISTNNNQLQLQKIQENGAVIASNNTLATNSYDSIININIERIAQVNRAKKTALLQQSYAGILGNFIAPVIQPLGYDWKIGIALITSFAAREVFVGTMATLYSVDDIKSDQNTTLRKKMASATRADGSKVYNLATGLSLLIFYVIAMQCMSTLAIVKRETKSYKWPIIQFVYMTGLAYLLSWVTYMLFK